MGAVFDDMMRSMATNPAGGFPAFLAGQEERELAKVRLSASEERRIGTFLRADYLRIAAGEGAPVVADARRLAYLQGLVEALAPRMARRARYPKIEITLIDAPIADAQAFPGGFLVFTTAVLDEPDEATVAGIVAHELAHLDLGHLDFFARRVKLASEGFAPGGNAGFGPGGFDFDAMMARGFALGSQMANPFRPEQELEADCRSTTWLFLEGYDPLALAEFFERLHARLGDGPSPFAGMRSHPHALARRLEVLDRLEQLRRWRPNAVLERRPDPLRALTPRKPTAPVAAPKPGRRPARRR